MKVVQNSTQNGPQIFGLITLPFAINYALLGCAEKLRAQSVGAGSGHTSHACKFSGYVEMKVSKALSLPERPLCVMGRLGRKKKRARGERWEGEREKRGCRLFLLPIVPRALSIFSIIAIFIGIPSGSLCGGESPTSSKIRKIATVENRTHDPWMETAT